MSCLCTKITAILFDLDDTLNDRRASWAGFVEVLRREFQHRIAPFDKSDILKIISTADRGGYRPKAELFTDLCEQLPWIHALTPRELEDFWRQSFPRCMVAREGARSILAALKSARFRLGIVTNGRTDMQMRKIHHMGLHDLVEVVIVSESVGVKKPQPEIFLQAVRALSSSSENTLFVGDNPELDIVGPAQVGMQTAWITLGRGWPAEYNEPNYRLSSLFDLRHIFGSGDE
ncbi:MAG TPA: HAD family hydrolase [Tepidisphaeraceae bacterium]|nr:HAD family hydrolase [Tepidisphaeraceae bacterium]